MGLAGSCAAGAVLVDGDEPATGRVAIFTAGRPVRLPDHRDGWRWEPYAVHGSDVEAARQQLQRLMRNAEPWAGPWAGIARLEMPSGIGRAAAVDAAERAAGWPVNLTRGPRTASAPAAGGRTPRLARGARGGARTQPRRTDGMIADCRPPAHQQRRSRTITAPTPSDAPYGAALESAPAGCQPGDTRVRRRPAGPMARRTRLSGRGCPQPRTPAGASGVRPEVERARSTPGTPTASHSSSGRPPGCRSTDCTSPGPLGPPTSCGTLRSFICTRPTNPHRASPLVVRKRRSRPRWAPAPTFRQLNGSQELQPCRSPAGVPTADSALVADRRQAFRNQRDG